MTIQAMTCQGNERVRVERPGHDGYRDELDVSIGARRHSVVVERAEPPAAFARVRTAVLAAARAHGR